MQDLNDFYFFVQVVDHGGFAPASRAIGVPKSKLSRRISLLEERLGARLLQRSSRHFAVTDVGREFYRHASAMLVEAEAAERAVAEVQAEPRGVLRVSCPIALLSFQFGELFAEFTAAHPLVELHLTATNRRVDVLSEGFDMAIRVRFPPLAPTDLVMRKLDESTHCLVIKPGVLDKLPTTPADLHGLPSVDGGPPGRDYEWQLTNGDGQSAVIPHHPRLVTDDLETLRQAALAGVGIAQLPTMMAARDIQDGRLIQLLPEWQPPAGIIHVVFPSRRGLLPSVRALLDFLSSRCVQARLKMTLADGHAPDRENLGSS